MSSETRPTSPAPDCDCTKQVEWQIAFSWMICLALNSMTQPSGRVCDLPSKHRFLLRSSPVICAFDAVGVRALWIAHMLWHLEAPSTAARRIARARFRDIENEDEEESLTSLEKNFPFRIVVFLFGALPQAIKLFASSGISWLKAWRAMYLGSWTVLEVLIWVIAAYDRRRRNAGVNAAAHHASATQLKWKRLRKAWATCAIVAHAVLLGAGTSWLLHQDTMGFLYFAIQLASALLFWHIFWNADDSSDEEGRTMFAAATTFIVFSSSNVVNYDGPEESHVPVWIGLGLFFGCSVVCLISMVVSENVMKRVQSKVLATTGLSLSFFLALSLNAYTLYVFLAWKYSAQGTSIPEWTRWLG